MNKDYKKDRGNWAKKEISLLTLLANESTDGSRKILKKYNKSDAVNHKDLENKLAELYFSTIDKVELEKEMAKIHPHREWLMKYEVVKVDDDKKDTDKKESDNKDIVIKEEIKIEQVTPDVKVVETKSSADGDCECMKKMLEMKEQKSNAEGSTENKLKENQTLIAVLGIVGIVAILGIVINKK